MPNAGLTSTTSQRPYKPCHVGLDPPIHRLYFKLSLQ